MEQKRQSWKQLKKISSKNFLNALREKRMIHYSEEEDCVLAETGISSSEEEGSTEEEEMIASTENFNVNMTIGYTRSRQRATRIQI